MNQNTPNPGVALRWPHPCSLPIEWGSRGCPPNVNLRPWSFRSMGGTGHPRSGCRQGTEMGSAAILARGIMINSRGERRTKALEGTEDFQQTPSTSGGETRGYRPQSPPIPTCVQWNFRMWVWGTPGYGGWPLIKINSFHNNIWFDLISKKNC